MFFFNKKKDKGVPSTTPLPSESDELKSITKSLYLQNTEIAHKNKTLSLLSQLYEISVLTLEPVVLAKQVSDTIQGSFLNFELVALYTYTEENQEVGLLDFAESERLRNIRSALGYEFGRSVIKLPEHSFFASVVSEKKMAHVDRLIRLDSSVSLQVMKSFEAEAHVKTSFAYPLVVGEKVIGILVLSLNRKEEELSQYERDSIDSFVNVVAVALDKAILYRELKVTNEKLEAANTKLKELDQLKTEFLSFASHQLRNPLTAVQGYTSNMLEGDYGKLPVKIRDIVKIVFDSAQSLVVMVQDFLDVSKIEQGGMKFDMAPFDIKKLVSDVILQLQPNLDAKGLKINLEAGSKNAHYTTMGDAKKLRQVIINLIDNSIKYTPKGGLNVEVKNIGDKVVFSVSDTGVGIASEEIPKLFGKFARAKDANRVNVTGNGLGLYLAKQIVEAHKGRVWVESPGVGKGSTFFVELPVAPIV